MAAGHHVGLLRRRTLCESPGTRLGELLALRWRGVDLESASLHVRSTLHYIRDGYMFAAPKTTYSRRTIALSPHRHQRLARASHTARRGAAPRWAGVGGPRPGVPKLGRQAHRRHQSAEVPVLSLLVRAGLPRMRFHDLRHTAATLLLGRGVNPTIVSEMLGHSHVSVTLGIYSHVLPHRKRVAAKAMNDALGGENVYTRRSSYSQGLCSR
jgi:integrase